MSLSKSGKYARMVPEVRAFSCKSQMRNVVKYCIYLDILLMAPIYVIKSTFLRGSNISDQTTFKSAAQLFACINKSSGK